MITQKFKKISMELEALIRFDISIERAVDLLEASTQDLEELIVINTIREAMAEMTNSSTTPDFSFLFSNTTPHYNDVEIYHA